MSKQSKKPSEDPQTEGKAQGLSFRYCYWHSKLYSRDVKGIAPYLYIIPFFLAYLVLDFTLRGTYRGEGFVGVTYLPACLITLGWALIFAGLVFFLPKAPRWFVRCVPLVTFVSLAVTHSGFMSVFNKFFSFDALTVIGEGGGKFVSGSYISIDWRVIVGAAITVILMMTSGRLLKVIPPKPVKASVLSGIGAFVVGVIIVAVATTHFFPKMDTVIWSNEEEDLPAATYQEFTDTTNSLKVCGLYQYTVRDLVLKLFPAGALSEEERQEVQDYITEYESAQTENEYTGIFKGKNLMMIQLEAIDTWMLDPDYMPNLAKLKSESICFNHHYAPAYITAGTFNTEFMTNTGLLPATGGIPTSVYSHNTFSHSLANLFEAQGYTARAFHNSEGDVYNRGEVHPNLGYESYTSGGDMHMKDYQMDRYLINGFDQMVEKDPFFSFVITYSGHGPYGDDSAIYQAHKEQAHKAAKRDDGNYVYAVAGAMETDQLIGDIVKHLEESGHLDDTVLVFYADHYNYYMMDDGLNMEIKGVDNMNMLQHTDCFIWSQDGPKTQVDKVTSTPDIMPTLTNLFGLDTQGTFFVGHDALSDQGGYVFFADGGWYDGTTYCDSKTPENADEARSADINRRMVLSNRVLSGNYYEEEN